MGLAPPAGSWGHAQRASAPALVPPGLWCLRCAAGTAGLRRVASGVARGPALWLMSASPQHSGLTADACMAAGPPARGHQTRLPTTQPQASNSSVSTVSRESQSRSWATSGFAGLHKGGGPRRHVHGGHHRRPAIAAPTLWGTVLPGLALATWCSAGWRDHPPESLSQKVASPHPTARQGPGVLPPHPSAQATSCLRLRGK